MAETWKVFLFHISKLAKLPTEKLMSKHCKQHAKTRFRGFQVFRGWPRKSPRQLRQKTPQIIQVLLKKTAQPKKHSYTPRFLVFPTTQKKSFRTCTKMIYQIEYLSILADDMGVEPKIMGFLPPKSSITQRSNASNRSAFFKHRWCKTWRKMFPKIGGFTPNHPF